MQDKLPTRVPSTIPEPSTDAQIGPRTPGLVPDTTSSPIDQLAAVFERWVSNPIRDNVTIEGVRLLQVMRLLARPVYNLTELHAKAEQATKVAAWEGGINWDKHRQAARDAAKAVDDAYSAILRDVDTLFTVLTGVPAHTLDALNLRVLAKQLVDDTRTLLAVNV